MKKCIRCKIYFENTVENFGVNNVYSDHLNRYCKECQTKMVALNFGIELWE